MSTPDTDPPPMTERQIVECLVQAGCLGTVKMSYDSGPYEITRSSSHADSLVRAIASARDAQWRQRLAGVEEDARRWRWMRDEAVFRGEPDGCGDMVWAVIGPNAYDLTPIDGAELDAEVDKRLAAIDSALGDDSRSGGSVV